MTRATRGQQAAAPSATRSIASAGDRGREMGRARRHSFIVRSLKLLLPVLAVVMVGSFAAFMLVTSQLQQQGITMGPITLDTKNLTMQKPQYVGFGKNGERFDVRAREAVTDLKQSGPVRLNGIDGDLFQATGSGLREGGHAGEQRRHAGCQHTSGRRPAMQALQFAFTATGHFVSDSLSDAPDRGCVNAFMAAVALRGKRRARGPARP